MQLHAWAPSRADPPALYARYTQVVGLHLNWDDVGGPPLPEEVGILAECISLLSEADAIRARVEAKAGRRR